MPITVNKIVRALVGKHLWNINGIEIHIRGDHFTRVKNIIEPMGGLAPKDPWLDSTNGSNKEVEGEK